MALMRLNDEIVMTPEMNFSKREKEILKWTAEGKTSAEIAMILSISENTVNFHQKNMQKKINAPNKTQVACYARYWLNLISFLFCVPDAKTG
ncbi:N-3-oxohexanoyl-L-homoserine lactone quorum-sensing transcriptional activator @ N-3-oxooctanoyl-L-homoserine lactone quorum-sensing transcriptional activator [Escherichia coli ISC41]|nr:N-3-oxohexanoyl-L-homoserine lactone quorum-sensing transcriptional activator @ N-3-oxooctanoyl-L-homoserine lactone quorum-sensing transcriptional activator [Escherichia coli ISC41]